MPIFTPIQPAYIGQENAAATNYRPTTTWCGMLGGFLGGAFLGGLFPDLTPRYAPPPAPSEPSTDNRRVTTPRRR